MKVRPPHFHLFRPLQWHPAPKTKADAMKLFEQEMEK